MERDVIPMCRNNGMSIAPWAVLGQGKFKTPEELKKRAALRGGSQPTDKDLETCKVLQEVASELGGEVHLAHSKPTIVVPALLTGPVALAWARQMMTGCFPILGGTSIDQLKSNIEALKIVLTPEQLQKLNDASPFDHGFPTGRFGLDPRLLPNQEPQAPTLTTVSHATT